MPLINAMTSTSNRYVRCKERPRAVEGEERLSGEYSFERPA